MPSAASPYLRFLAWPARAFRNLPIGWKLAAMLAGSLAMLAGVSWFSLDRMKTVGRLQDGISERAALERQVQYGMAAALDLRTISRELQLQQTVAMVTKAAARAEQLHTTARDWFKQAQQAAKVASEQALLKQILTHLDQTAAAVKHGAALRSDMLAGRQKRLFGVRPMLESSMRTFADEIAQGGAMLGGADAVRSDGIRAEANQSNPILASLNQYRFAMGRVQEAAMMFLATGNRAAVNEAKDGADAASKAMAAILGSDGPEALKATARTVATIGNGVTQAVLDLIGQTKELDDLNANEVETASQAMRQAIADLSRTAALHDSDAADRANEARAAAQRDIAILVGVAGLGMAILGGFVVHIVASPMRGLTRVLATIAGGDTEACVLYREQRDEIGQMAVAVETLRGVMRKAFVQGQMIEQIAVPVMTASAEGDVPVTYLNAEAQRVLALIGDHLPVPPSQILGRSLGMFYPDPDVAQALLRNPSSLPYRTRMTIGTETLEATASALLDRHGAYVGPMIVWQVLTAQTRLVTRFERSVGAIASAVSESAEAMTRAALTMTEAVAESGQRLAAVSGASEQASGNVSAAAVGAEELAMSVAEIGRQMEESTRIASQAVREADATDRCVGGLSKAAERIGDVVRLIGDIAARTNLLALNATIEAARAGEAGKGFAVVASEVKTLATQTAKATREIAEQIEGMRQSTSQAVGALRGIGATIQRMNEIATSIAGSVEEQGSATQEIARAVQQAAMGTNEVNDNIAVVDQAVGNTGTQSAVVLNAAQRLSEQSATLKAEVRDFLASMREAA